jgi:hypothetical protein
MLVSGLSALAVASGATHKVEGEFVLTDSDANAWEAGQLCDGSSTNGYTDIGPGENIVVKNGSGKIIATTSLRDGRGLDATDCEFKFSVKVPTVSFYQFSLGSRNRTITKSLSQMKRSKWKIGLSLGS